MSNCTATGCLVEYVPAGDDRERLLATLRFGVIFEAQHVGKRPEFLHNYIAGLVAGMDHPTFENLLDELTLAAARRAAGDGKGEPIESVSRSFKLLTYHHPRKGRLQVTFGWLRNLLTAAKITAFPKP